MQRPLTALVILCVSLFSGLGSCAPCNEENPCTEGCCSKLSEVCGYGPSYCGPDACIEEASTNGTCAHKSECDPGVYPGWGDSWGTEYVAAEYCPLRVCCSEFGFCGTTPEFCGDAAVAQPFCSGTSIKERTIAYYEAWNLDNDCNTMIPEDIPIGGFTHINLAFLYFDPETFEITPMEESHEELYSRVVALKERKPDLKVWIAIGGWAFSDPGPTDKAFPDLAASVSNQSMFFQSLLSFLDKYGFDGVDLDWEYPVAPERGGRPEDFENFVTFLENLRQALDGAGRDYGLSVTLPSSYWYLRHFDIQKLEKSLDWFNMMTYDLHGTWDADNEWIGSVVNSHTNLTEISEAMDLLWRNNIDPSKVVMGLAFYGRSFTLEDESCKTVGCPFSGPADPGPCTNTGGILSFTEIENILKDPDRNAEKNFDSKAAVQIVTFDSNQWVSYDDHWSFEPKLDYANSHCLGGTMVWAVDMDNDGTATSLLLKDALTGEDVPFPGDNGSNGGSNDIYVGPDLWTNSTHSVGCHPPCTVVLPPFPLDSPETVTWPPYTTSLLSSSGDSIYTKTTTIDIPPFVVTEIPFWPVTVATDGAGNAFVNPMQSVAPPSSVLTVPGSEAPFPVTNPGNGDTPTTSVSTPGAIQTGIAFNCVEFYEALSDDDCSSIAEAHDITLDDFQAWNPAVGSDCSGLSTDSYYCVAVASEPPTSTSTTEPPVFDSTSFPITIVPQPTETSIQPPNTEVPVIEFGEDDPPSTGGCGAGKPLPGCGTHDCSLFGCGDKCGFFGCGGGCGLGFCGGGCGLGGCGPGCGAGQCDHPGGGGGVPGEPDPSESASTSSCTSATTTTACDTACTGAADNDCVSLCEPEVIGCLPTSFPNIVQEPVIAEDWGWMDKSDDELAAAASSFASFINPQLTSMDPVVVDGTTLTASGPSPTLPPITTTNSPTSVTSCAIRTAPTEHCNCNGYWSASLGTKTNAEKTTFKVCDVEPEVTVTTLPPSSSTPTTSDAPQPTDPGTESWFTFSYVNCGPSLRALYVRRPAEQDSCDPLGYQLAGTFGSPGMPMGEEHEFCGQVSTFTSRTDSGLTGESDNGESYECPPGDLDPEDVLHCRDPESQLDCEIEVQWRCNTNICG